MIRNLKTITTLFLRPNSTPLIPLLKTPLFIRPVAFFSSATEHPLLLRLVEIHENQLEDALSEITKLNDENKQIAVKIILQRIKEKSFSQRVLLHDKFAYHLKKFPILQVRALLYRIQKELRQLQKFISTKKEQGKKIAVKDINSCFVTIFEALKRVPRDELAQLEIQACRDFANYNHKYLLRLVQHKRSREVLKKCKEFYTNALTKIANYLTEVQTQAKAQQENGQKEKQEDKPKEQQLKVGRRRIKKKNQRNQDQDQQLESMQKQLEFIRFDYAQEYSDILYKLMQVQNYLTDPRIKQTIRPRTKVNLPFQYHEGLFQLIPQFTQAKLLYEKVEQVLHSKFYYKIRKTLLELEHHQNLHKNKDSPQLEEHKQKEQKRFDKQMDQLTQEILLNLQQLPYVQETVDIQDSQCLILLGISINKLSRFNLTQQEFEQGLLIEVKSILSLIVDSQMKRYISAHFCHVIKLVTKLDFEKHLGKLPRITRTKQRKRSQKQEQEEE